MKYLLIALTFYTIGYMSGHWGGWADGFDQGKIIGRLDYQFGWE